MLLSTLLPRIKDIVSLSPLHKFASLVAQLLDDLCSWYLDFCVDRLTTQITERQGAKASQSSWSHILCLLFTHESRASNFPLLKFIFCGIEGILWDVRRTGNQIPAAFWMESPCTLEAPAFANQSCTVVMHRVEAPFWDELFVCYCLSVQKIWVQCVTL